METSKEPRSQVVSKDLATSTLNKSNGAVGSGKHKMSGKKVALIALGCVVAFIILFFGFANLSTSAPLKVSDDLVSYIKKNNPTDGYALLTTEAKATITSEEFAKTLDKISPYLTGTPIVQSKEVNTSSDNGNTAKIVYDIKGSDATYVFTVNLREVNGKWLVDSFESKTKK